MENTGIKVTSLVGNAIDSLHIVQQLCQGNTLGIKADREDYEAKLGHDDASELCDVIADDYDKLAFEFQKSIERLQSLQRRLNNTSQRRMELEGLASTEPEAA